MGFPKEAYIDIHQGANVEARTGPVQPAVLPEVHASIPTTITPNVFLALQAQALRHAPRRRLPEHRPQHPGLPRPLPLVLPPREYLQWDLEPLHTRATLLSGLLLGPMHITPPKLAALPFLASLEPWPLLQQLSPRFPLLCGCRFSRDKGTL